jgi:hypothetical protein
MGCSQCEIFWERQFFHFTYYFIDIVYNYFSKFIVPCVKESELRPQTLVEYVYKNPLRTCYKLSKNLTQPKNIIINSKMTFEIFLLRLTNKWLYQLFLLSKICRIEI